MPVRIGTCEYMALTNINKMWGFFFQECFENLKIFNAIFKEQFCATFISLCSLSTHGF